MKPDLTDLKNTLMQLRGNAQPPKRDGRIQDIRDLIDIAIVELEKVERAMKPKKSFVAQIRDFFLGNIIDPATD